MQQLSKADNEKIRRLYEQSSRIAKSLYQMRSLKPVDSMSPTEKFIDEAYKASEDLTIKLGASVLTEEAPKPEQKLKKTKVIEVDEDEE